MNRTTEFEKFIVDNADIDPSKLRLKYIGKTFPFDIELAITQIECRKRASTKLPFILDTPGFIFPTVTSAEQSTSEILAKFHASLIPENSKVIDMTAGLGIDDFFISKRGSKILTFEINEKIAKFTKSNLKLLNANNITLIHEDSIEWLKAHPELKFDCIFVDPARRDINNKRLFALSDCSPNIPENISLLKSHSNRLLIKVSPMADISQLTREIPFIKNIWVLSVKNECKELLLECDFQLPETFSPTITALNFINDKIPLPSVCFNIKDITSNEEICNHEPQTLKGFYIYIPDSSLSKSGGANIIADKFKLMKFHPNTLLYISKDFIPEYPGRVLKIKESFNLNQLRKKVLKGEKRNILCRNVPFKSAELAKLGGLLEGSEKEYLIAATINNKGKRILFDCTQLK